MAARATPMTAEQRRFVRLAVNAHLRMRHEEANAGQWVKTAVGAGVPLLTLANALGVSRSRIRRLAR
jgi:hypothetical protein